MLLPVLGFAVLSAMGGGPHPTQPASASDIAEFDRGFAAVQAATPTFRAGITQTLHLQGIDHPVVSAGTLYYQSPDKLFIRCTQPMGEWMLVNGSQAAIQKTGKPLERHDPAVPGRAASHAAGLLDFFHADPARRHQAFNVAMARNGDRLFVRLKPWMTPTATARGVQEIVTTLRLPGYDILAMSVIFKADDSVDYTFTDNVRNGPLDPALFQIPAP